MKTRIIYTLILTIIISISGFGQSKTKIDNIDFYLEKDLLIITYDILYASPDQTFNIWIKVLTGSGGEITPITLSGDIGDGVSGGVSKRILWDLEQDKVELDDEIQIDVMASPTSGQGGKTVTTQIPSGKPDKKVSVGKAVIFSLILPGAGNSYITGGGSQWLWGIVGYGCIVGSVSLNNRASKLLDDYRLSTDAAERDQLYSDAKTSDNISKALIGGAAAIWVIDLIWTAAQASKVNKNYRKQQVFMNYNYDFEHKTPMVGLTYKF